MAFIFYDTETTGTDTRFDQILQFAAIKTDENLEEIDRFEIRCRLLPHVIMSPGAMLVTGVSIEQATDPGLPTHYAMVRAIRAKMLEWAPAIFVGYNSLAFDEELLRQAQYQTLHNPYLTQREGNARADAMMLVKAVAQFEPDCLVIPSKANGRPNFKLDQLAPANGFDHSNAHDAMADVEAVIHLCRIIADGASAEWSNFIRFSQKAATEAFLLDGDPVLLSEFYSFGGQKHFPIICLGVDREQSTKHLCFDLSHDPAAFAAMPDHALMACITDRPKPLRKVKINAAPTLRSIDDAPAWSLGGLSEAEIAHRAAAVLADTSFVARLLEAYESSKIQYDEPEHVEQMIYGAFASTPDERLMDRFHAAPWPDRHLLLSQFTESRFALLGARIIYAESPALLPPELQESVRAHVRERLLFEGDCKWGTIAKALAECDEHEPTATPPQAEMLRRYRLLLQALAT
ncbi:exonuclease domain-containing protein [Sphingobium sp. TomTYG45]